MTPNSFFTGGGRPDQAQWARTNVGMASPLWWPFLMAAAAGVAWWTYANWARGAGAPWAGDLQRRLGEAAPPAPVRDEQAAPTTLDASVAVQGAAAAEAAASQEDDHADAIDAAYAANLGPVPAAEGARKPAGKKRAAKRTAAKKTTSTKTTSKKTAVKKTGGRRA